MICLLSEVVNKKRTRLSLETFFSSINLYMFLFFGGKRKRFESHAQAVSIMRDLGCRDLRDPRISHADNCEEIKFRIALIFNCRDLILFGFRWQMAI